jgi:DNA-binding Lrp family transcriptional regulator
MKKKDMKLLAHLRQNSRIPLTELSRKTQMPVSTIHDRIRAYKKNIIPKHTALLSFSKIGFMTDAYVFLKVEKGRKSELMSKLSNCPNINSCFKVNNGWDFMAECVFKDMCACEEFIESLESCGVINKEVHYVLEEIKRESFLSDPDMAEAVISANL